MVGSIQQQHLTVVICKVAQMRNMLFGPNISFIQCILCLRPNVLRPSPFINLCLDHMELEYNDWIILVCDKINYVKLEDSLF